MRTASHAAGTGTTVTVVRSLGVGREQNPQLPTTAESQPAQTRPSGRQRIPHTGDAVMLERGLELSDTDGAFDPAQAGRNRSEKRTALSFQTNGPAKIVQCDWLSGHCDSTTNTGCGPNRKPCGVSTENVPGAVIRSISSNVMTAPIAGPFRQHSASNVSSILFMLASIGRHSRCGAGYRLCKVLSPGCIPSANPSR